MEHTEGEGMKRVNEPKQDYLKERFEYVDGSLYRTAPKTYRVSDTRKPAGTTIKSGHRQIKFDQTFYYEHVLVWVYFNGKIPEGYYVRHKDGNPSNNKIENLYIEKRSLTSRKLAKERLKESSRQYMGIKQLESGRWSAYTCHDGTWYNLGNYETPEEAAKAYDEFLLREYGNKAVTNYDYKLTDFT